MEVAVVIPTYNRADMLVECVRSVLTALDATNGEVLVVDDASPDGTSERIREVFGGDNRVRCIRNERNLLLAVSRNNGAKAAGEAEYLLFIDDDNIVEPDMIRELVASFARHPDAGLVAPLALQDRTGGERLAWTLGSDFNRWTSRPANKGANTPVGALPVWAHDDLPTTYSPNAFMVKRDLFKAIDGFDEDYLMTFEESDFGWRIREAGYSCWIATKARTVHKSFLEPGCNNELRQLGIEKPRRTYCFARNRLKFARRHFSFFQALSVAFVFAPLSAIYYCMIALRNGRRDIAAAYFKGTLAGIFGLYR